MGSSSVTGPDTEQRGGLDGSWVGAEVRAHVMRRVRRCAEMRRARYRGRLLSAHSCARVPPPRAPRTLRALLLRAPPPTPPRTHTPTSLPLKQKRLAPPRARALPHSAPARRLLHAPQRACADPWWPRQRYRRRGSRAFPPLTSALQSSAASCSSCGSASSVSLRRVCAWQVPRGPSSALARRVVFVRRCT